MHNEQADSSPTAPKVTVPSPLARRQSATGSPEHVLVPTADCPEGSGHIIHPKSVGGIHTKLLNQDSERERSVAERPHSADGPQDRVQADWWRPLKDFLLSPLRVFTGCLLFLIAFCGSNSSDGRKCVPLKCHSLAGQCNCV